jgi:hypothetical protein
MGVHSAAMPAAQPINLDDKFSRRIDKNVHDAKVIPFVFGGQEWHLTNTVSAAVALSANQDPMAYLCALVVPEERDAFGECMRGIEGLDIDILIDVINDLGEILTGTVPTPPPARSSATPRKRTSGTRSKAT